VCSFTMVAVEIPRGDYNCIAFLHDLYEKVENFGD
jgi:hypothetical protein